MPSLFMVEECEYGVKAACLNAAKNGHYLMFHPSSQARGWKLFVMICLLSEATQKSVVNRRPSRFKKTQPQSFITNNNAHTHSHPPAHQRTAGVHRKQVYEQLHAVQD